jgi:hypothetical protein
MMLMLMERQRGNEQQTTSDCQLVSSRYGDIFPIFLGEFRSHKASQVRPMASSLQMVEIEDERDASDQATKNVLRNLVSTSSKFFRRPGCSEGSANLTNPGWGYQSGTT